MGKTCGVCEKSTEVGRLEENGHTVKRWCRCSVTGKEHADHVPCDVAEKPRLCEVLGVDVGERFKVRDDVHEKMLGPFFVRGDGHLVVPRAVHSLDAGYALIEAINHPEKIERIPRLTPEEVQRCRAFGAKWVGRLTGSPPEDYWAMLFSGLPGMGEDGPVPEKETYIGAVRPELFPSVGLGELIQVDEP